MIIHNGSTCDNASPTFFPLPSSNFALLNNSPARTALFDRCDFLSSDLLRSEWEESGFQLPSWQLVNDLITCKNIQYQENLGAI